MALSKGSNWLVANDGFRARKIHGPWWTESIAKGSHLTIIESEEFLAVRLTLNLRA
jgi:hypothetical protein